MDDVCSPGPVDFRSLLRQKRTEATVMISPPGYSNSRDRRPEPGSTSECSASGRNSARRGYERATDTAVRNVAIEVKMDKLGYMGP